MTWLTVALGLLCVFASFVVWAVLRVGSWADKAVADALDLNAEKGYRETREKID